MFTDLELNDYRETINNMDSTRYYTNHGPAAKKFESDLANFFGYHECVAVSNLSTAVAMVIAGIDEISTIDIQGPASKEVMSGLSLTGTSYSFSHLTKLDNKENYTDVLLDIRVLKQSPIHVFIPDSPFTKPLEANNLLRGYAISIIAHENSNQLDTETGASIFSNDSEFLEKMRNIRSSYGANKTITVTATSNGRFSEAQALLGITRLKKLNPI